MCYVIIIGSSAPDWICNTAQGMGYVTPQYDAAMDIGSNLPKNFVQLNDAVSIDKFTGWAITGHSLGGGLASAAAGVCGDISGPGYIGNNSVSTFNAAGLHNDTVSSYLSRKGMIVPTTTPSIIAYRTESDELTELQEEYDYYTNIIPNAAGTPYWLEDSEDDSTEFFNVDWPGHKMKSVIQGLLVDRIGRQVAMTYIIDTIDNSFCSRGKHGKYYYPLNEYNFNVYIIIDGCIYTLDYLDSLPRISTTCYPF